MDRVFSFKSNKYFIFFFGIIFYGTLFFWTIGYIIADFRIRDYGSWAILLIPFLILSTYILSIPLTFVFTYFDNRFQEKEKSKLSLKLILAKLLTASIYIFINLYFLLYKDFIKSKSDINYKADFNYYTLYGVCLLFALAIGFLVNNFKNIYNNK